MRIFKIFMKARGVKPALKALHANSYSSGSPLCDDYAQKSARSREDGVQVDGNHGISR